MHHKLEKLTRGVSDSASTLDHLFVGGRELLSLVYSIGQILIYLMDAQMGDGNGSDHFLSSYDGPGSGLSSSKAFPEHQAKMSIYTMGKNPFIIKSPSLYFH